MLTKKKIVAGLVILVVIALVIVFVPRSSPQADQPKSTGLPNPASVNCEELGGILTIKNDAEGGQVGFCTLPDQSVCEEWSLLRNECTDNSAHFLHLNLKVSDKITSPLKITGEVDDGWFFEGSFPINLVDWDGKIIATGLARSKADWMTASFVPFEAELKFVTPPNPTNQAYASKGAIIFRKDNPSGLPAKDKAYELPITF